MQDDLSYNFQALSRGHLEQVATQALRELRRLRRHADMDRRAADLGVGFVCGAILVAAGCLVGLALS